MYNADDTSNVRDKRNEWDNIINNLNNKCLENVCNNNNIFHLSMRWIYYISNTRCNYCNDIILIIATKNLDNWYYRMYCNCFSVDYVVHLASAYLESKSNIRNEGLSFALLTMGISVISCAITTFAAGICLIFPQIIFFIKMGTTVSISII